MFRSPVASAFVVAGVATASMFLAGCGGDDSSAGSASGTAGASAPPAAPAQMDPGAGMTDMEREMAGLGKRDDGGGAAAANDGMSDVERQMAAMGGGNSGGGMPGMAEMAGYGAGMGPGGQATQAKPARPANVEEWTDEQVLEAVRERDNRVTQAIEAKAAAARGDGAVVALLTKVLATASEAPRTQSPGQGGAGYPGGGYPGGAMPGGGYPGGAMPDGGYPGGGYPGGVSPGGGYPGGSGSGSGGGPGSPAAFPGATGSGGAASPAAFPGGNSGASIPLPTNGKAVSSLEAMLGEAVLSYAPQATQATRGSADRLQQVAQGSGSGSGGYAQPSADAGSGGYPGGMPPGYGAGGGYGADYAAQMGGGGNPYGGGQRPSGNLTHRELVETVVGALIENNSIQAWGAVQGIFAGLTPTPLPRHESAEIIISKIFASEKLNPLMAQQLVMGTIVSAGAQPQAGESTMRLLSAVSASVAETYLKIGPSGGPGAGQPSNNPAGYGYETGMAANGGGGFDPAGYAAQMGGGSGGFGPPGAVGGVGGGRPVGSSPPPLLDLPESAIPQAAKLLWGPQISQTVSGQLLAAPGVDQALPLLTLASTVPTADVRNATFELYSKHHAAGASGLAGSGIYQTVACDPGQLAVLKSLPRPPAAARERANPNAPPVANPTESWTEVTRQYVYSLRERLSNVSDDQGLAFTGLQPIRLHRGAPDPEAAIQIVIPDDAAAALGDAAPAETRVFYTRCRFSVERDRDKEQIAEHYQSRTKGVSHPDLQRGILWFDGVRQDADGTVTTMDVIIQQGGGPTGGAVAGGGSGGFGPGAGFAPRGGAGGPAGDMFVVETIAVVTTDPAKRGTAASVTALEKPGK